MTQRPKTARSRAARPTLEGLEARALLSTMHTPLESGGLRSAGTPDVPVHLAKSDAPVDSNDCRDQRR